MGSGNILTRTRRSENKMYMGIDIGSSSTKVAIIDEEKIIKALEIENFGAGAADVEEVQRRALLKAQLQREDIKFTVATGYGRINYENADCQITEITCHAKGVAFLTEGTKTIIDIGGQDAKVIRINSSGKVDNFVMNEKCAAGTGRFLEVMARVLGCQLSDLSTIAEKATNDIMINNVCTVFAESEVISRLSAGESAENVARGAHIAVAKRVMGMCCRIGFEEKIVMSGGVALNRDLVRCMAEELKLSVKVCPHCQAAGAIGAAVIAYEKLHQ